MASTIKYRTVLGLGCAFAAMGLVGQVASIGAPSASGHSKTMLRPAPGSVRAAAGVRTENPDVSTPPSADITAAVPDPADLKIATTTQREAAQGVILAQLNAFRDGDFEKADSYQAKSLRANFSSTQQFRIAMSEVYPEFTAYKAAQFGLAKADTAGHFVVIPVTLTGQDGVTVQALYLMVQEGSGGYRVLTVLGGMNPHPIIDSARDYQMT